MKKLLSFLLFIIVGISVGYFANDSIANILQKLGLGQGGMTEKSQERKVLYWVAPMDSNYRKDEPGKSMMGMDLLPVYEEEKPKEKEVLYWYAPMDANYRKDAPGKSMMGMDLLPFYKKDDATPGVVKISPTVQNNFGVRLAKVVKGDFSRNITTVGYISLDEDQITQVHTRVEGWIEKLNIKEMGANVKKGQKLFEIYSPELVIAQEEFVAAIKSKNQYLINVSKVRLASLGVSKTQIKKLQKTLKVKQRISYYANQTGFIEDLNIREGVFVKPSTKVLTIASIKNVWVIAEVFEKQSGFVKVGQTVTMQTESYPAKQWSGKIDFIYPVLNKKTRTLKVRIKFKNKDFKLRPNMFTQLTIKDRFDKSTLFVKREALIRTGTMDKVVKDLGDGKFLSVAVKVGSESGQYVEIIKGLAFGDKVVTSAQFLIDSESSLSASFERMDYSDPMATAGEPNKNQLWVLATITTINRKNRNIKLEHNAIEEWNVGAMKMSLTVDDNVNLNVEEGQRYLFLFEKGNDENMRIVAIKGEDQS